MAWIKRLEKKCMITALSSVPQPRFFCQVIVEVLFHWIWYWQQVKSRTVVQVFMYWLGVTDATSVYLHQMANHPAIICALTACQTRLCSKVGRSSFSLSTHIQACKQTEKRIRFHLLRFVTAPFSAVVQLFMFYCNICVWTFHVIKTKLFAGCKALHNKNYFQK